MDINVAKQLVAETGRILVEKGLVARTWGNISARIDETKFAISPSGLGYENMQESDVPIYDYQTETYEGSRKPSSEKKVHASAFKLFPEVNFVVHTHQDYATAIGLVGTQNLQMTPEEKELLGNIEIAKYGFPGTDTLKKNVEEAMKKGSKVILMIHHGVVILGEDREDAIKKAEVLEAVCKRTVDEAIKKTTLAVTKKELSKEMKAACKDMVVVTNDNILYAAANGGIKSQLDDIAMMIGYNLRSVENDDALILKALNKADAILVKGVGCLILTENPEDSEALAMLASKAAMSKRYTDSQKKKIQLSPLDCKLMNLVYKKKYSKQKAG